MAADVIHSLAQRAARCPALGDKSWDGQAGLASCRGTPGAVSLLLLWQGWVLANAGSKKRGELARRVRKEAPRSTWEVLGAPITPRR